MLGGEHAPHERFRQLIGLHRPRHMQTVASLMIVFVVIGDAIDHAALRQRHQREQAHRLVQ